MNQHLDLVLYKAYADFRIDASRGYLGILWWVLEPLLYMAVFYVVFGVLLKRGGEGYVAFLLVGLVVWRWFDSTVRVGINSLFVNSGLMKQVYVPKIVFASVTIATNTVKFLIVLAMLLLFLSLYGLAPKVTWLSLPVLIMMQLIFICSVTWLTSAIVPFIPDLKVIIDSGLTLLFFMSGIFFDIESLPIQLSDWLRINPMAMFIESYRNILIDGLWPDWSILMMSTLFSTMFLVIGIYLYIRFDRVYTKIGIR